MRVHRQAQALIAHLALVLALLLALLVAVTARAQDVQPVPALSGRVIDQTGTLSAADVQSIEARLAALEQEKGSQVVVLMVPTTQPEDIASYANRIANAWKIGRRDVGDGVLLLVAKNDRRVRIEVAKTLEGAIPDLAARRIIDEAITPAFRRGDYASGISEGTDRIAGLIRGEPLPEPATASSGPDPGFDLMDLAIFGFFAIPILGGILNRMLGRPLGSMLTGAGVGGLAWLLSASIIVGIFAALFGLFLALAGGSGVRLPTVGGRRGGWGHHPGAWGGGGWSSGSGGSGGFGGGGFSSGGGGDFGGGGASGDW